MQLIRFVLLLATVVCGLPSASSTAEDALDRFSSERLQAVHEAVERLQSQRSDLSLPGPLHQYRANMHVHSAFSHDSRGQIDDIVAAAKKVGTQVILFTEHPADHYDFFVDGHQGLHDGVLLIPGAEMRGLHVYPRTSLQGSEQGSEQELCNQVAGRDGLLFLCHLEERMDWELSGLTGSEIYNTHADFKDEKRLLAQFRNPLWLLTVAPRVAKFPQESYSALHNYPAEYLKRWDELCAMYPHTGVSANDAHQNIGVRVRLAENDKVRVEDALGDKLIELDKAALADVYPIPDDAQPDSVLFSLQLDRYEHALRHVATHLLMPELTQAAVWEALRAGRAFVAFDWLVDSTGFDIALQSDGVRHEMGSQLAWREGMKLVGQTPLAGKWKLIRNGELLAEAEGQTFTADVTQPGRYRVEVWLDVAGQPYVWILSNPFYITGT